MALYHRKLIFPLKNPDSETKSSSDCYLCYVCPDDCYLSPPPPLSLPPDQRKTHVSTVLILMLCILGVAFIILSYLTVARYRFRNSRRRNSEALEISRADFLDENQGPVLDHPIWYIRTVGFPQSLIDSIASFTFKKGDGLIEGNDCSICLSDFEENEILRLLPKCSHAFHVACIDTWLRSHKNCPVCRAPIVIATNASNESSSSSLRSSEENQGEVESREIRSGIERMVIEEERGVFDERNRRLRVVSDLGDHRVKVDQELYVLRRSVSMDFSSIIYNEKKDEGNMEMTGRSECKNSSICRMIKSSSLQNRPVSMKRSFSFSGKRSVRKNTRSLESIQLP